MSVASCLVGGWDSLGVGAFELGSGGECVLLKIAGDSAGEAYGVWQRLGA